MLVNSARTENGIIGARRRWTQPSIPIQTGFHGFFGQVAGSGRWSNIDNDLFDFTDAAVAHQLTSLAKLAHRALHRTSLEDAIVFAGGFDHRAGLMYGQRKRLLAVDIFAG